MEFVSEKTALTKIADTVIKAGVSLYNALKYIYASAEEDFYNVDIKDCLKIVLNNLTDSDAMQSLGIRINDDFCKEMNNEEYNKVLQLMVYSFAVRVPLLKAIRNGDDYLSDDQIQRIYNMITEKGAENVGGLIVEGVNEYRVMIRKNRPVPPYNADWYKAYIYTNVPSLSEITNKNMYLLGLADVLFTMFYSCLEEELENVILSESVPQHKSKGRIH